MNKIFGSLIVQFRDFFKNMGPTKRLSIIGASLILVLTVVVISAMISGRDYVPLLTNVGSDQLAMIVQKLNQKNTPYQLKDDGKTIAVPKDLLHATQMSLMAEIGSAKLGNVGLELFEKQDFGVNSYAQKINYQRALQGELMRAVNTLTAVKQSKVIISMPNKKNFLEESTPPAATVIVELLPGKALAADQVRGIKHLVASAIEGMDPEKVTVLDDRGKMLSKSSDAALAGSSEILDLKNKIQGDIEERIETILNKVVGNGKVIAQVDATLNHKFVQSVEETVDPEKTAVRSQQSEEESMGGSRAAPGGIPGSPSNLPPTNDTAAAGGGAQAGFKQDVKKEIKTINYDVPKTVRNIKEAAGSVERISVAVLVDGIEKSVLKEDGTTEVQWSLRDPAELLKYESLIKNSIGFNAARGDTVKVENIRFVPEDFTESDRILTSLERKKLVHSFFKWGLLAFSLVLFFFVVMRPFMQWITDSFQDSVEDMLPRTIEELEELHSVDSTLPGMSTALPILQESIDPDKAESELLKERILAMIEQDEEKAQSAFGLWLIRKDQ